MNGKITIFTKILLDFMYYTGIIVTCCVPFIITGYGKYNSYFRENIPQLSMIFIFSGLFAVLIIKELRKMFQSVLANNCFIFENVKSLNKMSITAL